MEQLPTQPGGPVIEQAKLIDRRAELRVGIGEHQKMADRFRELAEEEEDYVWKAERELQRIATYGREHYGWTE